ncbi:MAG: hypothetical protein AAGF49_15240 [Pseudomonadota bacterium]
MKRVYKIALIAGGLSVGGVAVASAVSPHSAGDFRSFEMDGPVELIRDGDRGWFGGKHGRRGGKHGRRGGMQAILREADANNDRQLTQEEIDVFIKEKVEVGDANGDGNLTLEEFEAVWMDLSRRMMVRAFQRLDEDGDAVVASAELDERFGDIVERMDRNDDGVLSRDDRRRGRGERRERGDR